MPIVDLHILEGYSPEEKQRLGRELTNAVRFVVPASPDLVTMTIHEIPAENYYRGGLKRTPAPARADPVGIVQDYLAAMEAREIETARSFLSDEFVMTFPGTAPMHHLEELIEWSKPRYKFVTKTYAGFDAMQGQDDAAIVYCRGTLQGRYLDDSPFEGIRFVDRFEIIDDKIARQDVWNDMAEVRTKP
ncbi:nuclear transport factor 2 family protein [Primorskyibacter sp. S87]|uniref:nuclear transport factor 2 family protein n=1 Tax=Primorskyibacter sp. S87 TaxID=3415126 RepID=UPI003C7E1ABB